MFQLSIWAGNGRWKPIQCDSYWSCSRTNGYPFFLIMDMLVIRGIFLILLTHVWLLHNFSYIFASIQMTARHFLCLAFVFRSIFLILHFDQLIRSFLDLGTPWSCSKLIMAGNIIWNCYCMSNVLDFTIELLVSKFFRGMAQFFHI